ncbi:MAG: orotidine-5'-phosphate decarboxylase, partial [Candidatus Krumholzibacteriota bacterium]|nr:orotidine-5'-phosphate decarboxylase [Candidatus Krumholzibacteriota bacterium]
MDTQARTPEIIAALDVEDRGEGLRLVEALSGTISFFKLGSRLFTAEGPGMAREIADRGGRVFLDLKFHDIPATVAGSVRAASALGVRMMTIHASGGLEMMRAAAEAAAEGAAAAGTEPPLVVGVTVLTSLSREDFDATTPLAGDVADL